MDHSRPSQDRPARDASAGLLGLVRMGDPQGL